MRKTSFECYKQIEAEGLLTKLRWEVYKYVYEHGPLTCREAMAAIKKKKQKGNPAWIADGSLSSRFCELERLGVFEITQERPCKESGRVAMEWDVTGELPKKTFARPLSRKQLEREIVELKKKVKDLENELEKRTLGIKRRNGSKDHQKAISRSQTSMF